MHASRARLAKCYAFHSRLKRCVIWHRDASQHQERHPITIVISDESTWPDEVSQFLVQEVKNYQGWECDCCAHASPKNYDSLVSGFREILRKHALVGYHCTRLTPEEIEGIKSFGMTLQDSTSLHARIDRILNQGLVSVEVAEHLKSANQADDRNRAKMLWFCFYEPFLAGELGIGRLFRYWGGEALYNSHESDPITGSALRKIGVPCVVKAIVPIRNLNESKFPDGALARSVLSKLGHRIRIPIEHEGYSMQCLSANQILDIFSYPSKNFVALTKCNEWCRYAI